MPNKAITRAQGDPSMAGRGDKFKHARGSEIEAPVGGDTSKATLEATTDSHREEADRQAIERGEDDGMIVYQNITGSASKRRKQNDIK